MKAEAQKEKSKKLKVEVEKVKVQEVKVEKVEVEKTQVQEVKVEKVEVEKVKVESERLKVKAQKGRDEEEEVGEFKAEATFCSSRASDSNPEQRKLAFLVGAGLGADRLSGLAPLGPQQQQQQPLPPSPPVPRERRSRPTFCAGYASQPAAGPQCTASCCALHPRGAAGSLRRKASQEEREEEEKEERSRMTNEGSEQSFEDLVVYQKAAKEEVANWQPTAQDVRRSAKRAQRAHRYRERLGPQLAPIGVFLNRPGGPRLAPVARGERVVRAVIDSGAEDTVVPPKLLPSEVTPSAMSRAGQTYRAANGAPIANYGKTTVEFRDADGNKCGMHFQVADVERPLVSVAKLADAGNRVVFDDKGGYVENVRSGRRVRLQRDGNVFVLDMHIVQPTEEEEDRKATGFARQER